MGFTALVPGRPQNAPGDMVPGEKAAAPVRPDENPLGWV